MHIDFRMEGGYANVRLGYSADTGDLPEETAAKIEGLIESSGVLDLLQSDLAPRKVVPDVFSYTVAFTGGGVAKSLSFDDTNAPVRIRPLLDLLRELALDPGEGAKRLKADS